MIARKWLVPAALLIASTLLSLALTEILLRQMYRLESLFDGLQYDPDLASDGWKRAFVRDYEQLRKNASLGTDLGGYVHDPVLGWDTPNHVRGPRQYQVNKPPGVFRVAVVGDSFTWGAEVAEDETYPRRLELRLGGGEVLNMGVRGYGIDQIALKYLQYGRAYRPDLLIVAIWTLDYVRTPLTFYRFAKPLYVIDPATRALVLTRTPVPPPDEEYRILKRQLGPFSYTYAFLREKFLTLGQAADYERYYAQWDPLIGTILSRLVEVARADRTPVLFLVIEHGQAFTSDALLSACCERKHLLEIIHGLSVDVIDLAEALSTKYSRQVVYDRMYIHHRGAPSGHFTRSGNEAVAEIIGSYIGERFGAAAAGGR
jgi:hypothetical protein